MISYQPFDQDARLGPPPWSGPAVADWEAAHDHDVRLDCYPEFGCQVLHVPYERQLENLRGLLFAWEDAHRAGDHERLRALAAVTRMVRDEHPPADRDPH